MGDCTQQNRVSLIKRIIVGFNLMSEGLEWTAETGTDNTITRPYRFAYKKKVEFHS